MSILVRHISSIERLLKREAYQELASFIEESLYETQSELNDGRSYALDLPVHEGSLQSQYLQLVETALMALARVEIPGISLSKKLVLLRQAEKNYGRPALMLSGGGTFGIYHIGVVASLIRQGLLPEVISGTSMGAIVAGMLATHHDHEVLALLQAPEKSHYQPLKKRAWREMFSHHSVLDDQQLLACIEANIGDATFQEAFDRTGREVSITISPSRAGQKPRILNHQTSPNVVIAYAAKASCSIPGLFPPCQLYEKDREGKLKPYLSDEKWYDGSFASDIPRQRISRLYNANFFIVSQANPHILPFLSSRQKGGALAFAKDLVVASAYAQCSAMLKLSRRRFNSRYWSSWTHQLGLMFEQEYSGDINIHPDFPWHWYLKFMKNPSNDEIQYLHQLGEQAVSPWVRAIHEQTFVSKTLRACIKQVEVQIQHAQEQDVRNALA